MLYKLQPLSLIVNIPISWLHLHENKNACFQGSTGITLLFLIAVISVVPYLTDTCEHPAMYSSISTASTKRYTLKSQK